MSKFNPNVKVFNIKGIDMIGNLNNSMLIGLNTDGKKLVDTLMSDDELDLKSLNNTQNELFDILSKYGFLN